jgi:Fe2+ or Zn2+ uptake regulation protein
MDSAKIISALDSDLRREILKILAEKSLTVSETKDALKNRGFNARYRETVYRALETLVDSGLVNKYYEKEKGLAYRLAYKRIIIGISNKSLDITCES